MVDKDKSQRLLDIYTRLCEGKAINKEEEALNRGISKRTIQRDLYDIKTFLENRRTSDATDMRRIEYDQAREGHVMKELENTSMSNSEILAVSKILLESRAFTREEISRILNKMVGGCVPKSNRKLVSELIANEKHHYVEIHHKSCIQDKLWEIGSEIGKHNLLELTYQKQATSEEAVKRIVQPLAILFSEYYFYLNANIVEKNEKGVYVQKYEYPAVFRIDRILEYKEIGEKFKIEYSDRFEEGEFRKRIQFMYMGKLIKLRFRYTGKSIESVLDRLPTAKIESEPAEGDPGWILTAEVYGRGVLMWLLTQGAMVEVLHPESARQEMKKMLQEMLAKYE